VLGNAALSRIRHGVGVRVGTLDHLNHLPPEIHIVTASKQRWAAIPKGHPAVEEYYDRNVCWPMEGLLRRERLLAEQIVE
jgi:hypothetical protein